MLTRSQKIVVAALGTSFVAQSYVVTRFFADAFSMQNRSNAMLEVINRNAHLLNDTDVKNLIKAGLTQQ